VGMDIQENGTASLEDLARRLEALERENAELRGKVAALEGSDDRHGRVAAASGSEPSEKPEEGRISRRRLLGRAGAAAAGLVVAGSLTQRDIREARAASPAEEFVSSAPLTPAVKATHTAAGVGVEGKGGRGVVGIGDNTGVVGIIESGSGSGVLGDSVGGRGVLGRSFGGTTGAVEGEHSGGGYGGQFKGGRAQLRLGPSARSGRPAGAHSKGEIYMDSNAAIFVCVRGGTPGRWRKVSTTAV